MSAPSPNSEFQTRMLRRLARHNGMSVQIAGHGMAKWLSASRALVRRGLAGTYRLGHYYATDLGRKWVEENPVKEAQ